MDRTDFSLLGHLSKDPLATHNELSHVIGLSTASVRKRLKSLTDRKILQGFIAAPGPEILGLDGVGGQWEAAIPPEDLFALEGTFMVGRTVEGTTIAAGYVRSRDEWVAAVTRLAGREPTRLDPLGRYDGPVLGPLDLRVLRALVESPRGNATELAELCGLAPRTVGNRRDALLKSRAVIVWPLIRPTHSGAIFYHLHVTCRADQVGPVREALKDTIQVGERNPVLCVYCLADDLDQQARRVAAVRALGVEKIEHIHEDEWLYRKEVVLRKVDEALAKWRPPADAGPAPV